MSKDNSTPQPRLSFSKEIDGEYCAENVVSLFGTPDLARRQQEAQSRWGKLRNVRRSQAAFRSRNKVERKSINIPLLGSETSRNSLRLSVTGCDGIMKWLQQSSGCGFNQEAGSSQSEDSSCGEMSDSDSQSFITRSKTINITRQSSRKSPRARSVLRRRVSRRSRSPLPKNIPRPVRRRSLSVNPPEAADTDNMPNSTPNTNVSTSASASKPKARSSLIIPNHSVESDGSSDTDDVVMTPRKKETVKKAKKREIHFRNAGLMSGFYEVIGTHGSIVRAQQRLSSGVVFKLPTGSRVHVVEIQGNRMRIDEPYAGWISFQNGKGSKLLKYKFQNQHRSLSRGASVTRGSSNRTRSVSRSRTCTPLGRRKRATASVKFDNQAAALNELQTTQRQRAPTTTKLDESLNIRTKSELEALIKQMVATRPELLNDVLVGKNVGRVNI